MVLSTKITSDKVTRRSAPSSASASAFRTRRPFLRTRPEARPRQVWRFLNAAIERGQLKIADVDLAAYQLTELCLAGLFRQCLFGYRTEPPSAEEIEHIVRSGVDVFLKYYGTEKLAEEESHQMIALEAKAILSAKA